MKPSMKPRSRFGLMGLLVLAVLCASLGGAQAAGPFMAMAGSWTGAGTVRTSGGLQEPLRCQATYRVGENGDRLQVALKCASDSYKFDLTGALKHQAGTISGSWSEVTREASGPISGRVTGNRIQAAASSDKFSANLSVTTQGNRQAVTIQSHSGEVTSASITLNKN